ARGLEVDDVQARAARDVERVEHRLRIAVCRNQGEVALLEAHGVALQQVERGNHVEFVRRWPLAVGRGGHDGNSRKFRRTRSPAIDDFSGWNCTPKTRPFCTAAVKGPP